MDQVPRARELPGTRQEVAAGTRKVGGEAG